MKFKTFAMLSAAALIMFGSCGKKAATPAAGDSASVEAPATAPETEEVKKIADLDASNDQDFAYYQGQKATGTFATADNLCVIEFKDGTPVKMTFFGADGKKVAEGKDMNDDESMVFYDSEGNEVTDDAKKIEALKTMMPAMESLQKEMEAKAKEAEAAK